MPSEPAQNRARPYQKSGLYVLKNAVAKLGSRALPTKRTALGRALHEWRVALIADLGGDDTITTQQRALVELTVRTKLLVDSVDAYVLGMPSPVNKRSRSLFPVVKERGALVGQLQSLLRDLGLERRAREVDIAQQLAAMHEQRAAGEQPPAEVAATPTP